MGRPSKQDTSRRRTEVMQLRLRGRNMEDIAEMLEVSLSTVSNDVKRVHEEWRKKRIDQFNEHIHRELTRINMIETELWAAWESSKEQRFFEETSGEKGETTKTRKGPGDPKYLSEIHKCIDKRCKLLGLYTNDIRTREPGTGLPPGFKLPPGVTFESLPRMLEIIAVAEKRRNGDTPVDAEFKEMPSSATPAGDSDLPDPASL